MNVNILPHPNPCLLKTSKFPGAVLDDVSKNKKQPMPKKAGVMTMTHTGQMTGQVMNPTMDMMEITPKVIGTIGHILLPLRN